eukprot:4933223-Prymnesium_polylepis.1
MEARDSRVGVGPRSRRLRSRVKTCECVPPRVLGRGVGRRVRLGAHLHAGSLSIGWSTPTTDCPA